MTQTQAVYYRVRHGREPVDEFIEALPAKQAAAHDAYGARHRDVTVTATSR